MSEPADRHECDLASAKVARESAGGHRAQMRFIERTNTLDGTTSYRRFLARGREAAFARADLEVRIAELYEGKRDSLDSSEPGAELPAECRRCHECSLDAPTLLLPCHPIAECDDNDDPIFRCKHCPRATPWLDDDELAERGG